MSSGTDTIAAVASPPGRGGIGVIRISGPGTSSIARELIGQVPRPRQAELHRLSDDRGEVLDQGLCLYFPAPRSFTGEDVLELQCHGGPVILDLLLARVLSTGARQARAGEFSERAFLNGKLDLAQAEAIADLIDSSTRQAALAASRSLQGAFSRRVHALVDSLTELRCHVEAAIDFPDEDIDFIETGAVAAKLDTLRHQIDEVTATASRGRLLREGMTLVIAGRPNAGKSSLMNALAGRETAIVTPVAGTTRDVLREAIQIDGMPLHLIDTAGLRDSDDPVETEGVRRAWQQIEEADRVLLVVDDAVGFGDADERLLEQLPAAIPHTRVHNKIDLSGHAPSLPDSDSPDTLFISARDGRGLDALRAHLKQVMGYTETTEGSFSARRRHLDALRRATGHVGDAGECLHLAAPELLADELRLAQQALAEITGEFSSDDLLGEIFAGFCIGK